MKLYNVGAKLKRCIHTASCLIRHRKTMQIFFYIIQRLQINGLLKVNRR